MPLTVAIVGLPNAGKSTLFNRLVGRRTALVSDRPGMTRDVREGDARIGELTFCLLDTAGHEAAPETALQQQLRDLTREALARADVCLFVVDARIGPVPGDFELAGELRRASIPVILVGNKTESRAGASGIAELWELGIGEPVAVSAEHGLGLADLYGALATIARRQDSVPDKDDPDAPSSEDAARPVRIALLGRPNTGKSTLANALLGTRRMAIGPEAGVTRDAISFAFRRMDRDFALTDTAGLRRRRGARSPEEQISSSDAIRAARYCDVGVLVLDQSAAFEQQDLRLASMLETEGRAVVIALNKWDLVTRRKRRHEQLTEMLTRLLPNLPGTPIVPISALHEEGLDALASAVLCVHKAWQKRIATGALNRWLAETVSQHPPPAPRGRRIRLRFATQTNVRPPTFAIFVSRPQELDASYRRYLANRLRESFGFPGVPLRLMLRSSRNPYAGNS